jgi:carbon monoxide dehydrogenase subunit G
MNLQHEFDVPASPEATLELLLDAERVVPCMPGATLVEVADDGTWKTTMAVKLGPVAMDFLNDVQVIENDPAAGTVRLGVKGRDRRGKGGADASVDARLIAIDGGGTRVTMNTDVRFSGQAAQLGRPSVIQDISMRLVDQFAGCIRATLGNAANGAESSGPPARAHKPVSGLSLLVAALRGALMRLRGALMRLRGALTRLVRFRPGVREKGSL